MKHYYKSGMRTPDCGRPFTEELEVGPLHPIAEALYVSLVNKFNHFHSMINDEYE